MSYHNQQSSHSWFCESYVWLQIPYLTRLWMLPLQKLLTYVNEVICEWMQKFSLQFFFLKSSQKLFSCFEVFECQKNLLKYLLITYTKVHSPIFKVPWGVTATCPWVVAGKRIPGLDSLIQNKVGVGFPAAIQSSEAGAPSATFWFDGSTKKIGGAETKKLYEIIFSTNIVSLDMNGKAAFCTIKAVRKRGKFLCDFSPRSDTFQSWEKANINFIYVISLDEAIICNLTVGRASCFLSFDDITKVLAKLAGIWKI